MSRTRVRLRWVGGLAFVYALFYEPTDPGQLVIAWLIFWLLLLPACSIGWVAGRQTSEEEDESVRRASIRVLRKMLPPP